VDQDTTGQNRQINATPEPATAAQNTVDNCCNVRKVASRSHLALVPCGHSQFCSSCIDTLQYMGNECPLHRTRIDKVLWFSQQFISQ
jgi:Zinc finger, C3HC4 type (RING finger)